MEMYQSILTSNSADKKALATKSHQVNDDSLQPLGALYRQLNHYKPHLTNPVTGSGVACKLRRWYIEENSISQVEVFILCNVNLCVKHFLLFHTIQTLVEDREIIPSSDKRRPIRGGKI